MAVYYRGMQFVAFAVEKTFACVDGLVSLEATVTDSHHRDYSITVMKPSLVGMHEASTVADFVRLRLPESGTRVPENFVVEEARIVVTLEGRPYTMRFSNAQVNTVLQVIVDSAQRMARDEGLEDRSLESRPVKATLRWEGVAGSHDVTEAMCAMLGPKSRWWWHDTASYPSPLLSVMPVSVMREALRSVYSLKSANRVLTHLRPFDVRLEFAMAPPMTVSSSDMMSSHGLQMP